MTICFQSCREKNVNVNSHLSLDDYESLDTILYHLNSHKIREHIDLLAQADKDSMTPDYRTRSYYKNNYSFLWISRKGIDGRADSLINCLQSLVMIGFAKSKFRLPQIESDLQRLRNLDFDTSDYHINKVLARLEYNLTKAYLRYVSGQRFGFMNPRSVFNHFDVREQGENEVIYHTLYDIKVERADDAFYHTALEKIHEDSIAAFIREAEPHGIFYHSLAELLQKPGLSSTQRAKILVNMERCRWRMQDYPYLHKKYILVNIPSLHLRAVDGDKVLTMKIALGSNNNKTPLMISAIKRMDINPQWVIPKSIIKKSILPHLGDLDYFIQHRYFIRNRETGEHVDISEVSPQMLESGDYFVIQRGGEGNALGRIVFRFDNNQAIYLHDTSSRNIFNRSSRNVSHGCVRVEQPFELSKFVLSNKNERLIDKIKYSMNADVSPINIKQEDMTEKMKLVADTLDRNRLIGSVNIKPNVPIFILYFTMYLDAEGNMEIFRDIYGYDPLIYRQLRNYI
jgi:murein L,D-transpeptidase YcbB/YkuD